MKLALNNIEVADMADRAAEEIEQLRRVNAELAPKAHAYDTLATVLGLLPQRSQGYGVDIAWQLRKRAEELRQPKTDPPASGMEAREGEDGTASSRSDDSPAPKGDAP